jgi:O-acetyl-ADP-ribose deacetylase (regulator of RNase III)
MVIEYRKGDLLDVNFGVIIHGCNSHGVMGSGVALAVKNKYPGAYESYRDYIDISKDDQDLLGSVIVYEVNDNLMVANMITQKDFGTHKRQVNYGAIARGFDDLEEFYANMPGLVFHFPKIGAGLGGGDWEVIAEIIEQMCPNRRLVCWEL